MSQQEVHLFQIRSDKNIPSADFVEVAEFLLKNSFIEFETKIIQQISGATICMFIYG